MRTLDDQIKDLDQLEEVVEPVWKTALAAKNKAEECLHALRALKSELYEQRQKLLKEALSIAEKESSHA